MRCAFCLTGKMGIDRNLTAGEIVGQVRVLVRELELLDSRFNIVLMGMGEPLHNYDETMKALRILADEHGLAVSPRRVTLSTVGVLPALERLATEPLMPNLAISLHATTEEQRDLLVPINRKYGLEGTAGRVPAVPAQAPRAHHVRIRDAEGRQRHAGRRAPAGHAATGIKAQGQLLPLNEAAGIPFERPVGRRGQPFRAHPRGARRHGVGAQVARPRHPRRVRPADHGVVASRGAGPAAGDGDGLGFRGGGQYADRPVKKAEGTQARAAASPIHPTTPCSRSSIRTRTRSFRSSPAGILTFR